MTDYKKRIEARQEDIAEIVTGHFPNASRKVLQEITDEFNELLHQVEAETDRNSRIDELENLLDSKADTLSKNGIRIYTVKDRIKALEHREES